MKKTITEDQKNAIIEGLIVFAWAGGSAIFPLIIAFMEEDPRWATLIPFINAIAFAIKTTFKNRQIAKND